MTQEAYDKAMMKLSIGAYRAELHELLTAISDHVAEIEKERDELRAVEDLRAFKLREAREQRDDLRARIESAPQIWLRSDCMGELLDVANVLREDEEGEWKRVHAVPVDPEQKGAE